MSTSLLSLNSIKAFRKGFHTLAIFCRFSKSNLCAGGGYHYSKKIHNGEGR